MYHPSLHFIHLNQEGTLPDFPLGTVPEQTLSPTTTDRPPGHSRPVLVVLEGAHDIAFFRHVSALLHGQDPSLPDLGAWEREGRVVLLPRGGGDNLSWTTCLAPLRLPEFHLLDREDAPATQHRQSIAMAINRRPNCQAVLTSKRSLDNYFHGEAIREVLSVDLDVNDQISVIPALAELLVAGWGNPLPWADLPHRSRRRWYERLKRWLYTRVLPQLSIGHLDARDPAREVRRWLRAIAASVPPHP
jgi:putative ATP-dependent endonuclease of the OLD family